MINKQNLWFLTLFSLILILGVYYVTMPTELLEKVNELKEETKEVVVSKIKEENTLIAMRVNLEESRQEKMDVLKEQLTSENLTNVEKNNIFEQLKYLNEIQSKEEKIEKRLKKELSLDCFTKIDNINISAVCLSNEHDSKLANQVMRLIQNHYKEKMDISVKFQKK